jgi:hypothetical protein
MSVIVIHIVDSGFWLVFIRTDLPTSVTTDTNLKSTDKEEVHHQDIHKS